MFFSKDKGPKVTDVVFLNEQGFSRAVSRWLDNNANGIVAAWFQHDLEHLRTLLADKAPDRFVLADRLAYSQASARPLLFAGHYPLRTTELDICDSQGLKEMLVYAHLDMALLRAFGSERIKEIMVKIGMVEDEPITHTMISAAIRNAQDKIAKQNITDMRALSEDEWMKMNVSEN